jgi:uncharacterized protein (TIGR03083 family)
VDIWIEVATRRRQLADCIDDLDNDALDGRSWCAGWRVRDVLGHLVYLAEATQWRVARDVVRYGPKPDRALDRQARSLGERPVDELTSRLRAAAGGRFHVLGSPAVVALGEVLVHGADMLRPIGVDTSVDESVVLPLLRVYRRLGRIAFHAAPAASVTLVATDAPVSLGHGPEVHGRAIDLLLLLANRTAVLDALTGPGLEVLSQPR